VSSDILDAIDSSLRDNSVSADAMRWSPDPEAAEAEEDWRPWIDMPRRLTCHPADLGLTDSRVILDEVNWDLFTVTMASVPTGSAWKVEQIGTMLRMTRTVSCVACLGRWRSARCRSCHPLAFPFPLPGGFEYRRRQQARRRRANR
jgi:hypothetical protein